MLSLQEIGDKEQQVARLMEQISEADAAHARVKQARNEALDVRKEAWRVESELTDQLKAVQAEFDRALEVRGAARAAWHSSCWHCFNLLGLLCLNKCLGQGVATRHNVAAERRRAANSVAQKGAALLLCSLLF